MMYSRIPRQEKSKTGPRPRFAVYARHPSKQPAIHSVIAGVDGDRAFVYTHSQKRALILPASSVFDNREDAERFLAGKGPFQWCVADVMDKDNKRYGRIMFEARVSTATTRSRGGWFDTIIVPKDKSLDDVIRRRYHLETFTTKRQAERYLRERLTDDIKIASKEASEWKEELDRVTAQYNDLAMSQS